MDCHMPGLSVPHHLLKFAQVHVHCIQPSKSSDALCYFCLQSFPESGAFPTSQLFASDDQNTGVSTSASVLPTSTEGWFPLRLTGLISLLSKGLSGVFSSSTVWRHQDWRYQGNILPKDGHNKWQTVETLVDAEEIKKRRKTYTEELHEKDPDELVTMTVWWATQSQTFWRAKSSGPQEAWPLIKPVCATGFQ